MDGQNGGSYSRFAKGFLFRSEEGRGDFIREAEALLSLNDGKAYAKGEIARAIRNAKVVDNDDLTPDAYRKRIGRTEMSDDLTVEEMFADSFEEVKDRVNVFKEMGVEQPSLAKRFAAWAKRIMDKFAEFFHNPEGKLTTVQRDSFVKAFGRLARDMKDGNGRPLFKVYKDGKEIRLTSGQLVTEGIKLSAKNDIDNGDKVGDNAFKITDREYLDGKEYRNRALDSIEQVINNLEFSHQTDTVDTLFDEVTRKEVADTNNKLTYKKKAENLQQKNTVTIITARAINAVRAKKEVFYHAETLSKLLEYVQNGVRGNGNSPLAKSIKARLDETVGQGRGNAARRNAAADGGRYVGDRTVLNARTGEKSHKSDEWAEVEAIM